MSDTLNKIRDAGIAAAIAGGSLIVGSQVGKPQCDYVLIDSQKEICMTEEQVDAVLDNFKGNNTGFGRSQFVDIKLEKK